MRRYELMLLFRPDLEDDKLQSAVEKVTRAIVNAGGTLTKVSPWGKRRLAYEIQHFREASYFLLHFDIAPREIRELERGMLISEEILRHLVTVLEDREAPEEEVPAAVPAGGREPAGDEEGEDAQEPEKPKASAPADSSADEAAGEADGAAENAGEPSSQSTDADGDAEESRPGEPVEA